MGDTSSSSRTFSFDASGVESIWTKTRSAVKRQLHPEMFNPDGGHRTYVREFVVVGDFRIDGKSAEEIAVYASLSELAEGVSFADEFEAWLFHLVRMCRYSDENESA